MAVVRGLIKCADYCIPNGAGKPPPKGPIPVVQMHYVHAVGVVNGLVSLQFLGFNPEPKQMQELCDKYYGAGEKVSDWCMIMCNEFDGQCEEAVAGMKQSIEGLKDFQLGASVEHAKFCSKCILGLVTCDGNCRRRFHPFPFFDRRVAGSKVGLMDDGETYKVRYKPVPKEDEMRRFAREMGVTSAMGIMKQPYPAAMALVSGKASLHNFDCDLTQEEMREVARGTSFENQPIAEWRLIVSEPIGESMTKEQMEVICEFFKLVHGMASLSLAEADTFANCVVGAVHSDGHQFRKFKVPRPVAQMSQMGQYESMGPRQSAQ